MFFVHFGLPNKFFSLKNRKLFLETKNKGKNQLPNITLAFPLPFMKLYMCAARVTEFGNLKTLNVQLDTLQNKKHTQTSKVKNKILIENVRNMLVCVCFFILKRN